MARTPNRQNRAVSVPDGGDFPPFRAGSELREARERLGWDLAEVAAALRIKLSYLQAIEDGQVAALPGNAYALGFLRTYATTLGLDPDEVARRFRAEARDVNRRPELAFPSPVPERGLPIGAMTLLGLVILVAGYAAWYRFSEHEQVATHTVPPVPEQLLAAPKAAPVSPQVASVMPAPGSPLPHLPPVTLPSQAAAPAASPSPSPGPATGQTASATPEVTATSPAPTHAPAGEAETAAPAPPSTPNPSAQPAAGLAPPPNAAQDGIVLHATAPTWVQVRDADGRVVYDHVMQAGDSWSVPADQTGLTMTTGNAGGLEVAENGATLGDFGRVGSVRHNISLTQDGVKAAIQPAAFQPPGAAPPATPLQPRLARPLHHAPPPSSPPDLSADQLNARQLQAR